MGKLNIRVEIDKLKKKLYTPGEGLDINDYNKLKWIITQIKKDKTPAGIRYSNDTKKMLDALVASGMIYGFSKNNYDYVLKELPMLPLVFANRSKEQPISSVNSKEKILPIYEYLNGDQFKFNYQMDTGVMILTLKGPSMKIVSIYDNGDKPFVRSINNIKYLSEIENISESDAIELLLGIYNCDYAVKDELKDIVEFYKDELCSDEFYDFLSIGRKKAIERNIDTTFYDKVETFINIVLRDTINPDFIYEEVPKKLVLERK